MEKLIAYLEQNPVQHLATLGLDGKAKCRPFMFATEFGGKLWFCTSNQKEVYKELQAQPSIELSVSAPDFSWCRVSGEVKFENNITVKERCIESISIVKQIYKSADNPNFEVFYISKGEAMIADFSGNEPQIFNL